MTMFNELICKLNDKISSEYYNSLCDLLSSYDMAMKFLKEQDSDTYENFNDWYATEGVNFFTEVIDNIIESKLNNKFNVFMGIYKSYLDDAINDNCIQIVLDFLYIIPKNMRNDFSNFGFLENNNS